MCSVYAYVSVRIAWWSKRMWGYRTPACGYVYGWSMHSHCPYNIYTIHVICGYCSTYLLKYLKEFDVLALQSFKPLPCGIGSWIGTRHTTIRTAAVRIRIPHTTIRTGHSRCANRNKTYHYSHSHCGNKNTTYHYSHRCCANSHDQTIFMGVHPIYNTAYFRQGEGERY